MKNIIPLFLILPIILGLLFPIRYNVNSILSEAKKEYSDYMATANKIKKAEQLNNMTAWQRFVNEAYRLAKLYNFPAQVLIAQGALESSRGNSYLAQTRNNFLGINAVDHNPNAAFSFETPEDCARYWVKLISNHYPAAWQVKYDPVQMISNIKAGGYATSGNYVNKVLSMSEFWQ